jgi:hypothetical protein
MHRFHDNDPFFAEVLNLIDIIKDIEEDPETQAAQILSTYGGMLCYSTFRIIFIETNRCLQNVQVYMGYPQGMLKLTARDISFM